MDATLPIPPDTTQDQLIELWLHGKSPQTIRAYRDDVRNFLNIVGRSIRSITLADMQRYVDSLTGSPASRRRRVLTIKSLLSFAARLCYTPFNVGAAVKAPKVQDRLAERILTEEQVLSILGELEESPRDHALVRLLYHAGIRVAECVSLQWRNLSDGVLNVEGKGIRTRVIRVSAEVFGELLALRGEQSTLEDRIFPMTAWNAWDRVRRAAIRAGIEMRVTPHFFRHSHATHALRRGADLATVRDTLGHSNVMTTSRYLHARPDESSGAYLPA